MADPPNAKRPTRGRSAKQIAKISPKDSPISDPGQQRRRTIGERADQERAEAAAAEAIRRPRKIKP